MYQLSLDTKIEDYEKHKKSSVDHVETPRYVVEDIYNRINVYDYEMIWFPFNNYDSEFKTKADELKLMYSATHKFDSCGNDFFVTLPPDGCDLMISNPPFGLQNEIIARSFELIDRKLIKSFALLLPISTLQTVKRGDLYEKYEDKISIIIFKSRIKFKGHNKYFNQGCCWICFNVTALER